MDFEIWADADSIPKNLRPIVLKAASRIGAACRFVADRALPDVRQFIADDTFARRQALREQGVTDEEVIRATKSLISMHVVTTGANSADDYIVQSAPENSLCITHDIPLAARLLEKKCIVIDDRGYEYTASDIRTRLADRLVNQELRTWGVFAEQQGKMDRNTQKAFADTLDKVITRMKRR